MLHMKSGSFLIRAREGQQLRFSIQTSKESQTHRGAGSAGIPEIAWILERWLRRITPAESIRQNYGWLTGQVSDYELLAAGWRHDHIEFFEYFRHGIHSHSSRARCLNIFHRRNESRGAEAVWPVKILLRRQELVLPRAREIIKRGRGFRREHRDHGIVRKLWHLHRHELYAHFFQFRKGRLVVLSVVLRSCPPRFPTFLPLLPFFEFFRRRGWFLLRRFLLLVRFFFEISLQITDAQFSPIEIRVPIECRRLHGAVVSIGSVNCT